MKRKADDDPGSGSVKYIKKERDSIADYSQDVKRKINASARTGQACDRCRVRKMRCDDQRNGCGPCLQSRSECKTTDRITGKATVRGYVQSLESRLEHLQSYTRELEARLLSLGEDAKTSERCRDSMKAPLPPWPAKKNTESRTTAGSDGQRRDIEGDDRSIYNMSPNDPVSETSSDEYTRLPEFRAGLAGNNYLGISTGNSLLSSIHGTAMNVLGMEIDLADYMSQDADESDPRNSGAQPMYNKSYRAFVQTTFGISPKLSKVELPPRSEGLNYVELYFRVLNCYLPILHRPSFIAMITKVYDEPTFKPSFAETVMIHSIFAIMYYQIAMRASHSAEHRAEMNQSSNFHYHYALGFFGNLLASHTLADAQALTLLCLHIRNFPKPGPCWMITRMTLDFAIELGLHRSAKRWAPTARRSMLEIEIRKRVFWSLLSIHVIVAGNLGLPMALRSEDWDVEMPEAVDDELLSDNGLDASKSGKCSFLVGLEGLKFGPLYMDLYKNIYAVKRSPQTYVSNVMRLEKRIQDWSEAWPAELKDESNAEYELGRVHVEIMATWPLHIRLLLRHPSLSLATSPEFNSENLSICMEVSRKMLYHVERLQKYNSLDGTWQNGALYILAIATALFGHWERRESITSYELSELRRDMNSWLSIISDMSDLLGSGKRLQDAVRVPIDRTLSLLSDTLSSKMVSMNGPSYQQESSTPQSLPSSQVPASDNYQQIKSYQSHLPRNHGLSGHESHTRTMYSPPSLSNLPLHPPLAYQDTPQYPYHMPYTTDTASYPSSTFTSANALPVTAAAATAYLNNYQTPSTQAYNNSTYSNYHAPGSPTSWRNWAGDMASNLEPGAEYMSSASALMQLGGRSESYTAQTMRASGGSNDQENIQGSSARAQTWSCLQWAPQ